MGTCGTSPVLEQNGGPMAHPTHHPWVPIVFGLLLLQLQTQPEALLVGWLENLDGRFCRGREGDKPSVPPPSLSRGYVGTSCPARPHSPGPSRYWEREKRRRRTMGSVRSTFHAVATSSCQGRDMIQHSHGDPQPGKEIWGPLRSVSSPSLYKSRRGHPGNSHRGS